MIMASKKIAPIAVVIFPSWQVRRASLHSERATVIESGVETKIISRSFSKQKNWPNHSRDIFQLGSPWAMSEDAQMRTVQQTNRLTHVRSHERYVSVCAALNLMLHTHFSWRPSTVSTRRIRAVKCIIELKSDPETSNPARDSWGKTKSHHRVNNLECYWYSKKITLITVVVFCRLVFCREYPSKITPVLTGVS